MSRSCLEAHGTPSRGCIYISGEFKPTFYFDNNNNSLNNYKEKLDKLSNGAVIVRRVRQSPGVCATASTDDTI